MAFEALQKRCLISYTAPWPLRSWVQSDGRRWPLRMSFTLETAAFPACGSTAGAMIPSCVNGIVWQGRVWSGEASTYDGLGTVEAALTAICRVNPHGHGHGCRGPLFERNCLVSGLRHRHWYHTAMSCRRGLTDRQTDRQTFWTRTHPGSLRPRSLAWFRHNLIPHTAARRDRSSNGVGWA